MTAPVVRHPLATTLCVLAGLVFLVAAIPCLASPAGWVYLAGELLLAVGVLLVVAPVFRGGGT